MPTLHYASNLNDDTHTACDKPVGYLLMDQEDDVTTDETAFRVQVGQDACKDCLEELNAERE